MHSDLILETEGISPDNSQQVLHQLPIQFLTQVIDLFQFNFTTYIHLHATDHFFMVVVPSHVPFSSKTTISLGIDLSNLNNGPSPPSLLSNYSFPLAIITPLPTTTSPFETPTLIRQLKEVHPTQTYWKLNSKHQPIAYCCNTRGDFSIFKGYVLCICQVPNVPKNFRLL